MNRYPQRLARFAIAVSAALLVVIGGGGCGLGRLHASVTSLNATQAQISFTPTTPALYVDIHYLVNRGPAELPHDQQRRDVAADRQLTDDRHRAGVLVHLREERPTVRHAALHLHPGGGGGAVLRSPRRRSAPPAVLPDGPVGVDRRRDRRGDHPVHGGRFDAHGISTLYTGPFTVATATSQRHRHRERPDELRGGQRDVHDRALGDVPARSRTFRTSARTCGSSTRACPPRRSRRSSMPTSTRRRTPRPRSSPSGGWRNCSSRAPMPSTTTSASTPRSPAWVRTRTT